jgi:hypothetical protein
MCVALAALDATVHLKRGRLRSLGAIVSPSDAKSARAVLPRTLPSLAADHLAQLAGLVFLWNG